MRDRSSIYERVFDDTIAELLEEARENFKILNARYPTLTEEQGQFELIPLEEQKARMYKRLGHAFPDWNLEAEFNRLHSAKKA